MKEFRNIIDTWNMIEKYNLQGCKEVDSRTIEIPADEAERLMSSVKNRQYIKNLMK